MIIKLGLDNGSILVYQTKKKKNPKEAFKKIYYKEIVKETKDILENKVNK